MVTKFLLKQFWMYMYIIWESFCSNIAVLLAQASNISVLTCQSCTLTAPKRHKQKDATEHHLEM